MLWTTDLCRFDQVWWQLKHRSTHWSLFAARLSGWIPAMISKFIAVGHAEWKPCIVSTNRELNKQTHEKVKGWKLLIRFSFVSVHVSPVVSSEQWRRMLQAPQLLVSFFFLFLSFFCPDDAAIISWLKDLGRSTVQGCESLCTWFWWMLEVEHLVSAISSRNYTSRFLPLPKLTKNRTVHCFWLIFCDLHLKPTAPTTTGEADFHWSTVFSAKA